MKKNLSVFYKLFVVLMCGIGLYINFRLFSVKDSIVYFTIQSNLLCLIVYIVCFILYFAKKLKKSKAFYVIKGMATMAIALTMIVYWALIATNGGIPGYDNSSLACNFVHLFVPLLIILDYLIFDEKGNIKKDYPVIWSLVILAYLVFDLIYVSWGGKFLEGATYPYYFMDIQRFGFGGVTFNCLVIFVFFVGCGYLVYMFDSRFKVKEKK